MVIVSGLAVKAVGFVVSVTEIGLTIVIVFDGNSGWMLMLVIAMLVMVKGMVVMILRLTWHSKKISFNYYRYFCSQLVSPITIH